MDHAIKSLNFIFPTKLICDPQKFIGWSNKYSNWYDSYDYIHERWSQIPNPKL